MKAINYASIVFFAIVIFAVLIYQRVNADVSWATKPLKRIVVLSIDTGLDIRHEAFKQHEVICPHADDCRDFNGHGTHIASLILNGPLTLDDKPTNPVCPAVEFYSCDYKPATGYKAAMNECLELARKIRPDFVNFSSVGQEFSAEEYMTYAVLYDTTFIVAAGNEGNNLRERPYYFPADFPILADLFPNADVPSLKNVITVGARTSKGRWNLSNYADFVVYEEGVSIRSAVPLGYADMSGTSMATAIRTNKLVKARCNEL